MGVTNWDGCEDFETYVFKVFTDRVSRRKELEVLVSFHGKKRMKELWEKYRRDIELRKREREKLRKSAQVSESYCIE